MKRLRPVTFFGVLFTFLFLGSRIVFSQLPSYSNAYSDYLYRLDVYTTQNTEFENARDSYLQNSTLGLKEKTRSELYDMLQARDDLIASYLTTIGARLSEIPEHPGSEKGDVLSEIPAQVAWFNTHKTSLNRDNDSLETLFDKSEKAADHFNSVSFNLIYETLSRISFSKFIDMKVEHEDIYKPAKAQAMSLEGSQRELYSRWIRDIDAEFQKVTDAENYVHDLLVEFKDKKLSEADKIYSEAVEKLNSVNDSFLLINGYLTEMVVSLDSKK